MEDSAKRKSSRSSKLNLHYAPELQVIKTRDNRRGLKYQSISDEVKGNFISEVLKQTGTIKLAAEKFNLNFSTAKAILHTFRKDGRMGRKLRRHNKNSCFLKIRKKLKSPVLTTGNSLVKKEKKIFEQTSECVEESYKSFSDHNVKTSKKIEILQDDDKNQKEINDQIRMKLKLEENNISPSQNSQQQQHIVRFDQGQIQPDYQNLLAQIYAQRQIYSLCQPYMNPMAMMNQQLQLYLMMNLSQQTQQNSLSYTNK